MDKSFTATIALSTAFFGMTVWMNPCQRAAPVITPQAAPAAVESRVPQFGSFSAVQAWFAADGIPADAQALAAYEKVLSSYVQEGSNAAAEDLPRAWMELISIAQARGNDALIAGYCEGFNGSCWDVPEEQTVRRIHANAMLRLGDPYAAERPVALACEQAGWQERIHMLARLAVMHGVWEDHERQAAIFRELLELPEVKEQEVWTEHFEQQLMYMDLLGTDALTFDKKDMDGNPLRSSDFRGKPLMVFFWGDW